MMRLQRDVGFSVGLTPRLARKPAVNPVIRRLRQHRPLLQHQRASEASSVLQDTDDQPRLLLPVSWELQMDEAISKYINMDERLDAMERQLMEMTRELRTGSASITGGVTSMSQGGTTSAGATSGLFGPVQNGQGQHQQNNGHSNGPLAVVSGSSHPPHSSGTTSRGVTSSGGLISPGGASEKNEVVEEGKRAAAAAAQAHRAQESRQSGNSEAAHAGSTGEPTSNSKLMPQFVPNILSHSQPQHEHEQQQQQQSQTNTEVAAAAASHDSANRQQEQQTISQYEADAGAKAEAVAAARVKLLERAAARTSGQQKDGSQAAHNRDNGAAGASKEAAQANNNKKTATDNGRQQQEKQQQKQNQQPDEKPLLGRDSLYGFNKLQSAITELANSGYIESIKQLRESLLIQEWDMSNRHLAKRRGVAMFERYVAEHNLVEQIGGYSVISALYEDPDAVHEVLHTDRMRMLARSMIEECLNERRMALYHSCTQTAKEMATLTSSGVSTRVLLPLRQGVVGALLRLVAIFKGTFLPWTRFIPFLR